MAEEFEGKGVDEKEFPFWAHGILFVAFVLNLAFFEGIEFIKSRNDE